MKDLAGYSKKNQTQKLNMKTKYWNNAVKVGSSCGIEPQSLKK